MSEFSSRVPYLSAAVVGAIHAAFAVAFWGYFPNHNPVFDWLIEVLAKQGHEIGFRIAVYALDLVVSVLIAIPFAILISTLNPKNEWKYLWVALAVFFCLLNWSAFVTPQDFVQVLKFWSYYIGTLVTVSSVPLAYYIVLAAKSRASAT